MAPSWNEVFKYVSVEMHYIIETSITEARHLGHTQVTPLHVIERIRANHYSWGFFCGICVRCEALDRCISNSISRIPITFSAEKPTLADAVVESFSAEKPTLADAVVESIRTVNKSLTADWFSDMEDVEKLFAHLLDDPTVSNVMGEAGFSITVLKNKLENRGDNVKICDG